MSDTISIQKEDANNYSRILTLLGMDEEGDPVAAVEQLSKDKEVFVLANEVAQGHITELRAEMAEAVDILDNFISAVSSGGNYSKETTLVFLGQVRQCLSNP